MSEMRILKCGCLVEESEPDEKGKRKCVILTDPEKCDHAMVMLQYADERDIKATVTDLGGSL